ncbi:hypothetical protein [[Clostridium] innocuum]|uniref:hypothetical protein n=1 Tax=Clostridium innocuum TaxID=1522 RepID=UPI0006C11FE2|nr:hypothetical protein [[Clostridium] innocuum]CUQ79771.1 FliA/WhiG subfamily RNA polymerase sigma-28 subunit [[Clostridium] innocuum]
MQGNEFLNRPFILNNKINDKKIKLGFYRELSCSPSLPGFEEHFSSNPNTKAPFVRYLEKIDDLEREIVEDYKKLDEIKTEVDNAIDVVEDPMEQMILRYRYLEFLSMPDISVRMHYSLRWTKKLHRRALDSFERGHP